MSTNDTALIAHLMRRAGFGARYDEIEALAERGYDATVDWLLNPVGETETDDDITLRFTPMHVEPQGFAGPASRWLYRILNTRRPLEEKMTLFWHCVFATGFSKLNSGTAMWRQYEMLHAHAMGNFRELLLQLSKDPAMIYWLDNCDNHDGTPNENYGRELMELFSMGIGNYTEDDVKMAARAFTGWTYTDPLPRVPYLFYHPSFEYRDWDHDDSEKTFLGESGNFNGEDIIDIIVKQPATGQFIGRHLYNFFVADEPQVPAWPYTPPNDPDAVNTLAQAYIDSGYEMRAVLETLFKSDFFKEARFKKVKSPLELVSNTVRMTGDFNVEMGTFPKHGLTGLAATVGFMGQQVFNPPSVEGWHTGKEWIDGGTLTERVNYAVDMVSDPDKPGIRRIVDALTASGAPVSAEQFVDTVEEVSGFVGLTPETRNELIRTAEEEGELTFGDESERTRREERILEMVTLVVATREYQFA